MKWTKVFLLDIQVPKKEGKSIKEDSARRAFAFILLGFIIYIPSILATDNSLTECTCKDEPKVCPQYSIDTSCQNSLPLLISPLDKTILIKRVLSYSHFSSKWRTTSLCDGKLKLHTGVDLRANPTEVVRSIADGTVVYTGLSSSKCPIWADVVIIDHGGLFTSIYEHVTPAIEIGKSVKKGAKIASIAGIANTLEGCGTGNHLHFGIRCGGLSGCKDSGLTGEYALRSGICLRGALPLKQSICEYTSSCYRTYCRCDPKFPGGFLDPLDLFYANYINQAKLDGSTITVGSTIDDSTVIFRAKLQGPRVKVQGQLDVDDYTLFEGKEVRLQVELRRLDEYSGQFDDTKGGLKESAKVKSGNEATVRVDGLINGKYHWRARAVCDDGTRSNWVEFGNNEISEVDFIVSKNNAIVGEWTLHSRLDNTFVSSDTTIIFNEDHTVRDLLDPNVKGKWTQDGNTVHWEYDNGCRETVYDGTIGIGMKGIMQNNEGDRGDWSAEKRYYTA